MRLPEISIRHPVLAIVFNLVLVVIGVVGFTRLDLRFFPVVKAAMMTIQTHYQGADAQLMENRITTPLENAIGGVPNINVINSWSSDSYSTIWVHFLLGSDTEQEMNAVRDKVASVRSNLPASADPSVITVGSTDTNILNSIIKFFKSLYPFLWVTKMHINIPHVLNRRAQFK